MAIDPRQLLHLLAIHEYGSLSKAAEPLGLSQPALSNSIATLERRLGAAVLNRTARGATVNGLGAILVRRTRELRSVMRNAEDEVRLSRSGRSGPLAIGVTPSVVEHLIPATLKSLRSGASSLSVTVVEGLDEPLDAALLNGELDLVIGAVGRPGSPAEITEETLLPDPYVLGVGPESALSGHAEIALEEALGQPWVLPRPGGSAYAHVHAIFLSAGLPWPQDCIHTNSAVLTKRLISQSAAVGLVNILTLAGWDVPISTVQVREAGVRNIGVRQRLAAEPTPLTERFLEILRKMSTGLSHQMPARRS